MQASEKSAERREDTVAHEGGASADPVENHINAVPFGVPQNLSLEIHRGVVDADVVPEFEEPRNFPATGNTDGPAASRLDHLERRQADTAAGGMNENSFPGAQ
jgi:hypothetical protein